MPRYLEGNRDFTKPITSLLSLFPNETPVQTRVVLTTRPRSWSDLAWDTDALILDLTTLLGISGTNWRISDAAIIEEVIHQLRERGWRVEQIVSDYRPDLRFGLKIDVAVFDDDHNLIMAVEVKRTEFHSAEDFRRAFQQLATSSAKWLCVTDGENFHVMNAATGDSRVTEEIPSPTEVGSRSSNYQPLEDGKLGNVYIPSEPEDLEKVRLDYQPEAVILDQSLPYGLSVDRTSPPQFLDVPIRALLPKEVLPIDGRVEALHVLMAWAASQPSIRTISGVVPSSTMRAPAYQWLRNYLHRKLRLCGIIELPPEIFRPAALSATLFYLGGNRNKAYFDVLSSRGDLIDLESRPWFESLSKWMNGQEPKTGYTINVDASTVWAVGPNDPELERIYERLARIGELVSLDELCDVRRGIPLGRGLVEVEHGIPYLQGRSVRDGYVNLEDARTVNAENIPDWALLKSGDILLSEVITDRSSVTLYQSNETAILSSNIIVLRLRSDRISAEYLVEYLNSSTAQKLILANASRLGGLNRISHPSLRQLKVPIFDAELFQGLSETSEVEEQLHNKADELESTRLCLFDSENQKAFREKVNSLKRVAKIIATSLKAASTLDFQIANFYPFPVAYSFRLLASKVNSAELYKEQLRVAENLLAFLASISLSLVQKNDLEEAQIDIRTYWQSGISPGDWKAISARCSKIFSTYKDVALASAILELNVGSEKRGFGANAKLLIESLNDYKHHRGPSVDEDYLTASQEVGAALREAMEKIAFFTEYPIRQIQDINPRRNSERVDLKCLRYTGDHPGLPTEEIEFHQPLHKGDLFIDLGRQKWISLYPFITSMNCPNCKTRETYMIDKWDPSEPIAYVKSFERGHPEKKSDIAEALQDFLIKPAGEPIK